MHPDFRHRRNSSRSSLLQQDPESGDFWSSGPITPKRDDPASIKAGLQARFKLGLGIAVALYLIATPILREAGVVPPWLSRATLLVGMVALAVRLLTFRRWNDEMPYAKRFFVAFAILIVELYIENFFIWVVAASDFRKYAAQEPLQDNILVAWQAITARLPAASVLLRRPWAEILQLLVALILLGVSVLFDQVPFSGFGMMTRAIHTIWITRVIRTVAFMLTVLPSQRPGCYQRRFPPVPASWWRFLVIGFTKLRAMGGCNDLIISGHAIIYVVAPLAFQTYYPGPTVWLLWLGVAHSCIRAPLTLQHYSVDMWLAVVVTGLVWHWCAWAYDNKAWRPRHATEPPDARQWTLTGLILCVLVLLAYIVIAGGA